MGYWVCLDYWFRYLDSSTTQKDCSCLYLIGPTVTPNRYTGTKVGRSNMKKYRVGFWSADYHCSWPFVRVAIGSESLIFSLGSMSKFLGISPEFELRRDQITAVKEHFTLIGGAVWIDHTLEDVSSPFSLIGSKAFLADFQEMIEIELLSPQNSASGDRLNAPPDP